MNKKSNVLGTCLSDCFLESVTRFLNKKDGSVKAFGFYKMNYHM